eukprot:4203335-Karenia_brevis.AAC.1
MAWAGTSMHQPEHRTQGTHVKEDWLLTQTDKKLEHRMQGTHASSWNAHVVTTDSTGSTSAKCSDQYMGRHIHEPARSQNEGHILEEGLAAH